MAWSAADIEVVLDDDGTSDPVMTAALRTPLGLFWVMAEPSLSDRTLVLRGLHLHGEYGAARLGWARWRQLIHAVMEKMDVDEILDFGATRTTGANPGGRTRPQRYARTPDVASVR